METEAERVKRMNMEQDAEKHPIPGRRGPRVFHWEDVDGFRLHTNVTRDQVKDMWDMYSASQRWFDSFHNEWDVCTEFDADAIPDGIAEDTFSDFHGDPHETIYIEYCAKQGVEQDAEQGSTLPPVPLASQEGTDNLWREDLMAVHDGGEEFHYTFDPPPLKTVLNLRYGLSPSEIYNEP
jgi:hypothetical protein